ncbi:MAG: endolytic transglycosylase MltG [Lamprobacter sp.]|uniref:endolytic transglycosylase MltG n=1 Tax=Lamprobacter sp. TaxID=3100796 RepID=UPI002B25B726|nr:endolytic transglycosylase MltG [Lamprobacter sp.]MEA3638571.1 endolytic transglycosylase MltG [Lamprobacter sp.]
MRAFFAGLLSLLLVGVILVGVLLFEYQRFLATPVERVVRSDAQDRTALELESALVADRDEQSDQRLFEIRPGTRLRDLAARLADEGLIGDPYFFIALAYQERLQSQIKAGEYAIVQGMRPRDLLRLFASGRSVQYPVTLIEGWTFRDALDSLSTHEVLTLELAGLSDAEVMQRIGIEDAHPEGWLFPDTYLVTRDSTDVAVLKRAHARMKQVLNEEWGQRLDDLPIETPYEALILASIIEKETGLATERPDIAGVFVRRLRRGMRLQTDPTVIYGMGDDYDGNIRRQDLRQATAYNTYVIDGLPPTPIALPGREALHAALNPAAGDALYFVSRGDGSHHFSATLKEHNCAVRKYQLGGRCDMIQDRRQDRP